MVDHIVYLFHFTRLQNPTKFRATEHIASDTEKRKKNRSGIIFHFDFTHHKQHPIPNCRWKLRPIFFRGAPFHILNCIYNMIMIRSARARALLLYCCTSSLNSYKFSLWLLCQNKTVTISVVVVAVVVVFQIDLLVQ